MAQAQKPRFKLKALSSVSQSKFETGRSFQYGWHGVKLAPPQPNRVDGAGGFGAVDVVAQQRDVRLGGSLAVVYRVQAQTNKVQIESTVISFFTNQTLMKPGGAFKR